MYNYCGMYSAMALNDGANISMDYWTRSLYQRLTALIDFKNLPEADGERQRYTWDIDALKYALLVRGFMAVINSKTYGVVPVPCTLAGYGIQYQPTSAIINTPYFQFSRGLLLGAETELLKLTPDYTGVFDIVTKYAAELREIDTSIKASARNSRLAYALIASNDKTARTLKAVRERIQNGDDAIIDESIMRKKASDGEALPWFSFEQNIKENFILNDLLDSRRKTLVDFYREIGVRMTEDKRERLITAEVAANNVESFIRSEVWAQALKTSVEKVNKMFDLNIIAKINTPQEVSVYDS